MKFSKRDVKIFIAGVVTFMIINIAWNWEENLQDFKDGYNAGYNDARNVESNE